MSVAVVTIAIIFAGYQIAFAHKRISDVAPILLVVCWLVRLVKSQKCWLVMRTPALQLQLQQWCKYCNSSHNYSLCKKNIVFRGCTRPATFLGVPYIPFFIGAGSGLLMGMYFNLFFLLTIPFIILIMRQMAKRDDMIFRFLGLRLKFRLKARNREEFPDTWCFSPNEVPATILPKQIDNNNVRTWCFLYCRTIPTQKNK